MRAVARLHVIEMWTSLSICDTTLLKWLHGLTDLSIVVSFTISSFIIRFILISVFRFRSFILLIGRYVVSYNFNGLVG